MSHHRLFIRTGASVAAVALAAMAAGPAFAAGPVAQSTASALKLNIATQNLGTGTFAAQNDGKTETTSGSNGPSLNAVAGQTLLTAGTASQDAKTAIVNGAGQSAACAAIAGTGSSLVSTGVGASCLKGGSALSLDAGHIDLSKVTLTPGQLLSGIAPADGSKLLDSLGLPPTPLNQLLTLIGQAATPLTATVDQALQAILGPVSNQVLAPLLSATGLSVGLNVGGVYSSCQATPTVATGAGTVASLGLRVGLPAELGGALVVPVKLNTGENVPIVTGLDQVVDAIKNALTGTLTALVTDNTILAPLKAVIDPLNLGVTTVVDALNANLIKVIAPQLKPLEDNVLKGVLNKVERRDSGRTIDVTALDLQVLPVAATFLGGNTSLVGLSAAHVTCGPNSTVAGGVEGTATTTTTSTTTPTAVDTPTEVKSGIGSLEGTPSAFALAGLAGLVLAGTSAGVIGFRRSLRQP